MVCEERIMWRKKDDIINKLNFVEKRHYVACVNKTGKVHVT
jgi:hypothetical protein